MRIELTSVLVEDQDEALRFYTDVLGFVKKTDLPLGEFRWLTLVSPQGHDDVELLLEPNANPVASKYQEELFEQGIPLTAFAADDVQAEYERLGELGVTFRTPPTDVGTAIIAVFDDTCGNLIQVYQAKA